MTRYSGLENTLIFTGISFNFQLVYAMCPSVFHSLNKTPDFQAEGVMSRGVK